MAIGYGKNRFQEEIKRKESLIYLIIAILPVNVLLSSI
jgi:hypothetical protein